MQIVKVDERGRLCLKKVIMPLPEYYEIRFGPMGKLILTPIKDVESLNKEDNV